MPIGQVLAPVGPALDVVEVGQALVEEDLGHGQQHGRLAARIGGHPVVGLGGGVGKPRVHHRQLRPRELAFHDPLGVGIEVVAGLEVRREQEDEAGVRVVRTGTVVAGPERIAQPGRGRAHVGVRVVAVDPPRLQDPVHGALVARPAHVVHDLVAAALPKRLLDAPADVGERFLPAHPGPLAFAALPRPLQGVEDALRVVDLVDGGRALGAVAPAGRRMQRVAFELPDAQGVLVHVGEQAAGGLAVEADGGHQQVALLHPLRPLRDVVLAPVVPLLGGGIGLEVGAGAEALDGHVAGDCTAHSRRPRDQPPLIPRPSRPAASGH